MRKILLGISMVLVLALGMWGCATNSDLEKVQAQQRAIDAKLDQVIQDAQAAKAEAKEAQMKADDAAARANDAVMKVEIAKPPKTEMVRGTITNIDTEKNEIEVNGKTIVMKAEEIAKLKKGDNITVYTTVKMVKPAK